MQKIKLKNNTYIENIQFINGYTETINTNDKREIFSIKVLNNTVENLRTLLFLDNSVLDSIEIYGQVEKVNAETQAKTLEWTLQRVHERYNLPCSITQNLIDNSIDVKIARKSTLEQQLLETQLALVELGTLIGGTK